MAPTVEQLTLEVAKALEPLRDRLAADQMATLFSEMGLPAPEVVLAAAPVTSAVANVVGELDDLPPLAVDLADAIEAEQAVAIASATAAAAAGIAEVVDAARTLADAIDAMAGTAGGAGAELTAFAAELPERLMGFALATYLQRHQPVLGGLATLFGIVEATPRAATAHAPAHVRRVLRLDRIGTLMEDPVGLLGTVYGWDTADFNWDLLLTRLDAFTGQVTSFAFVQPGPDGGPPVLRIALVDIGITEDEIPGLRASVRQEIDEQEEVSLPIRPGMAVEITIGAGFEAGAEIDLLPPAVLDVRPPTLSVSGRASAGLSVTGADGGPVTILGIAGGTRLEAGRLRASAGAELEWDVPSATATGVFIAEAAVEEGRVVLSLAGADGFLSAILPEGDLALGFDLLAGWSSETGLYMDGGTALSIDIPVDIDLGPIKVPMLHLGLGISTDGLELEASGAISAQLGPFAMAVERMGANIDLTFPEGGGNLGPAELGFSFKPPSGIGLSLDAGVVKGGGYLYLDPEAGEYAGVLELSFGQISIKALGILTTELPGGEDGWAFLALVFGEFPAIQLGFGFTLNGVGGAIGLQHGVSIEELQSGLRTGVLDAVLFPDDPVANAPALLGQLRVVFPIVPRALTVGPALKLGWSTPALVTVKLGLILQFDDVLGSGPGPPSISRIVLLGQLKVQLPPVDELGIDAPALVQLQIDIVGAYDFDEQELSIDAVLRDSFVAFLSITGSLVVRARFGADPTFVLAVGGFHPRFKDLPPGIPEQQRVGIQLDYDIVTVQIVGYVAITSNSFQTGAEASLRAAGAGFSVEAYLGFDALFIFEPVFHFEIDFRVGASIRYEGISLASIRVTGRLKGPGRWEVSGSATISILFFDVDIDFEVEWGDAPAPELPSVAVGPQVAEALSAPESWSSALPGGAPLVTLRSIGAEGVVVVHPLAAISGMQRVVPLGVEIDRVGQARPSDATRFAVDGVEVGGRPVAPELDQEHFARGEFIDLSEEEKLSGPSFERFDAGVSVSTADHTVGADQIAFEPEWETAYLRQDRPNIRHLVPAGLLVAQTALSAVARSALRRDGKLMPADAPVVSVTEVGYVAEATATGTAPIAGGGSTYTAATREAAAAGGGALVTEIAEVVTR